MGYGHLERQSNYDFNREETWVETGDAGTCV